MKGKSQEIQSTIQTRNWKIQKRLIKGTFLREKTLPPKDYQVLITVMEIVMDYEMICETK